MDAGLLVLRMIGLVFSLHGFQKLFGWFGGGGLDATAGWFDSLGFRGRQAALMAGFTEAAGGLGIAFGLLVPVAAAGVIGTMTVAAYFNNRDKGFWSSKNGWELNLLLIIWATGIAMTGPGQWSLANAVNLEIASPVAGLVALLVGVGGAAAQLATRRPTG